MRLDVRDLRLELGGTPILSGCSLHVAPGSVVAVVGRNGSGKTTLLRCIYRQLVPDSGVVLVGDDDVQGMRPSLAAQRIAAVPQMHELEFDFTVRDLVLMGRGPHLAAFARFSDADHEIVDSALRSAGIEALSNRIYTSLSGGERQRVHVARALAQQSPVLVLDEPTNHLDLEGQFDLLELIRSLGRTTVMSMHDLSLASRYCDEIVVLIEGHVLAAGPPRAVLTPELIHQAFGVEAEWTRAGADEILVLRPHPGR